MKKEKLKIYLKVINQKNGVKVYKKELHNMLKKIMMKKEPNQKNRKQDLQMALIKMVFLKMLLQVFF